MSKRVQRRAAKVLTDKQKAALRKAGWKIGSVQELLGLTDGEMMTIDLMVKAAIKKRKRREG